MNASALAQHRPKSIRNASDAGFRTTSSTSTDWSPGGCPPGRRKRSRHRSPTARGRSSKSPHLVMTKILDRLPYADALGSVVVRGEQVSVLAHQIIVWVSLSPREVLQLDEDSPRIPAILDTGNTFGFSIAEEQ